MTLKAPYPWFGGKSRVADVVWRAFGNVPNYVEPFFGSGAVLLGRPHPAKTETINDLDCFVANFWRAIQKDPASVAQYADWPVSEVDLHARHLWLVNNAEIRERMSTDPNFCDAMVAGWWVWGLCSWIGSGWCQSGARGQPSASAPGQRGAWGPPEDSAPLGNAGRGVNRQLPHLGNAGHGVHRKIPHLGNAGRGVNRQLPHLGNAGHGVHRKIPHLGDAGRGVHRKIPHLGDADRLATLVDYFGKLADRLRSVRICCGDWTRVMGNSVTWRHGTTAIFLDPPYDDGAIDYSAGGRGVGSDVAAWCRENGDDDRLRVALCGFDGDHDLPGWSVHKWKAHGGFSGQRSGDPNGNPHRERIWFSPHCLPVDQPTLFGHLEAAQ